MSWHLRLQSLFSRLFPASTPTVEPNTAAPLPAQLSQQLLPSHFPQRVLCVCSGNICRSPYAELLLRKLCQEAGRSCQIYSAGTLRINAQPAAPMMQKAALKHGIDLSQHRSNPLSKVLIQAADYILVMSPCHYREILRIQASAAHKMSLLGSWLSPSQADIADPMGLDYEQYLLACTAIDQALSACFQALLKLPEDSLTQSA